MSGRLACVAAAALWSFAGCDRTPPHPNSATPGPVDALPGARVHAGSGEGNDRCAATAAAAFPPPPLSGNIPVAIPAHDTEDSPEEARPFFDTFSWQSFVALNWPAKPGQRGVPDQPDNPAVFTRAPNGTAVVWGSYKTSDDLFAQGEARPSPWDSTGTAAPGAKDHPPGTRVFARFTKTGPLDGCERGVLLSADRPKPAVRALRGALQPGLLRLRARPGCGAEILALPGCAISCPPSP